MATQRKKNIWCLRKTRNKRVRTTFFPPKIVAFYAFLCVFALSNRNIAASSCSHPLPLQAPCYFVVDVYCRSCWPCRAENCSSSLSRAEIPLWVPTNRHPEDRSASDGAAARSVLPGVMPARWWGVTGNFIYIQDKGPSLLEHNYQRRRRRKWSQFWLPLLPINSHIIPRRKQTLFPQASLQQLFLPGLIMEQNLLHRLLR